MTVYLIPVGTHGSIAAPDNQPKPLIAQRQLQFREPPAVTGDFATFNFAKCRLTVPRAAVIVWHENGVGVWKTLGREASLLRFPPPSAPEPPKPAS